MIKTLGMSITGPGKQRCEDAHLITHLKNGSVVAAIADGVGSARFSDKAAQLAVREVSTFLKKNQCISEAFEHTFSKIATLIKRENGDVGDYDITLTVALYDGNKISYGHSGDGGIVAQRLDGKIIAVTKPQKGSDNLSVIPFRSCKSWVFGETKGVFSHVLMATDGVYDTLFPYLLRGQPNEVYMPMLKFFFDNTETDIHKYLTNATHIMDDKTVVIMSNTQLNPIQREPEYYAEPNWEKLKEEWNKKAYPHLYAKKNEEPK